MDQVPTYILGTPERLAADLNQCDWEIERFRGIVARVDGGDGWMLALKDWQIERNLIIMEQIVQDALRTEPSFDQYVVAMERLQDYRLVRLLHVGMGLATEAGEFVDTLKKHIFYGKAIDATNLIEELGDTSWYQRVGCDALEVQFVEMLRRNVEKLRARFPDKFSEERANTRDLDAERKTLEGQP